MFSSRPLLASPLAAVVALPASAFAGILALTACGAPPPPPHPPPPVRHAKEIVTAPPSATPSAPPPASACREEASRDRHGFLSFEAGKWIVEGAHTYDTRVWEMTPDGPKLRARVESGNDLRFLPGDRLANQRGDDTALVDLATGKLRVLPKTWLFTATADYLFVGATDRSEPRRGRRLRTADLSEAGAVTWGDVTGWMRGPDDLDILDGGNSLAIGETLVSFATGKVLRERMLFGAPSPDGKHISACDSASRSIVEVDAATGLVGARFPLKMRDGVNECSTSDSSAYAGDHTIFWFEHGKDTRDAGDRMIVAAGDTRTGKVTRFDEPSQTWSIGFSSYPFFEDGRICTTIASFHTSWRACDWVLSGDHIVRSPEKPRGPTAATLGLKGTATLARAVSPSGERVALLTYRVTGKGEATKKSDLRVTFATIGGKKEASIVLEAGQIALEDSTGPQESGEPSAPWASLAFFDEATISIFGGRMAQISAAGIATEKDGPTWLVNARTGVAKPLCGAEGCYRVGRFVVPGEGKIEDPLAGQVWDMTPGEAEWAAIPRVERSCP